MKDFIHDSVSIASECSFASHNELITSYSTFIDLYYGLIECNLNIFSVTVSHTHNHVLP